MYQTIRNSLKRLLLNLILFVFIYLLICVVLLIRFYSIPSLVIFFLVRISSFKTVFTMALFEFLMKVSSCCPLNWMGDGLVNGEQDLPHWLWHLPHSMAQAIGLSRTIRSSFRCGSFGQRFYTLKWYRGLVYHRKRPWIIQRSA